MAEIKVVSFDVEGTLVTPDFSYAVWFEAIPKLYAQKAGIDFEKAQKMVTEEYEKIGDQRLEWYNIRYWFNHFQLGNPDPMLQNYSDRVCCYPEVIDVLSSLGEHYKLIVASGSPEEFLHHLLQDIRPYFVNIFSSISDYGQLKTADFYLNVCQAMKIPPAQIVHVGDNQQFDFLIPKQVGIRAFHLDRKRQANCQGALTNLTELKSYLLG